MDNEDYNSGTQIPQQSGLVQRGNAWMKIASKSVFVLAIIVAVWAILGPFIKGENMWVSIILVPVMIGLLIVGMLLGWMARPGKKKNL